MSNQKIKDLKFIIIFIVITAISLTYLTQTSLAKYRKQLTAKINVSVAEWNIKVNNETINNKTSLKEAIIPSFTGNEFVKDSVIAPGSQGYCDIIIDATNVDVDFTYEISATLSEESNIPDLKLVSYTIDPATNTTKNPYDENTKITGNITKNSQNNVIRLYIKWEEENGEMDNIEDTLVAINEGKAAIETTLRFHQRTN